FVGHVALYGFKSPPNAGQLYGATKLHLGAPFLESEKGQALASIRHVLAANGFYHASVDAEVQYDPRTQQSDIAFDIHPGKRARFEMPAIIGHPEYPVQNIVDATHWKRLYGLLGWQEVTESRIREGLDNVRKLYQKRDLLRARVALLGLQYHGDSNTVAPSISVQPGPKILVRITGAHIASGQLKQLVPVFQELSVDRDLLIEGQRNIEQYLQSRGYFSAAVSFGEPLTTERTTTVTYRVDSGGRHKFVLLGITGSTYFPESTIRERLYEVPAEFPRFPYGRFSTLYLQQDIQTIKNLYASNGFRNANITYRIQDDFQGVRDHLAVFIHIDEGPQTLVSSLSIEGVPTEEIAALRPMLAAAAGQPLSDITIASDRDNLLNYYYGRGYLNASFEYSTEPANKPYRVMLRYLLRPGPRKYVRDVLISGLQTTRRKLVLDRIELRKGEPISLAEETDSQRRLYDLGIFARVNTALQNPDGDEDSKYVLYDIDEAKHYSINVGAGAQIARIGGSVTTLDNPAGTTGFSPRVAFGITRDNFLGLGQMVGLQTAASTIEQHATLTYFIPQFVSNEKLSLTTTMLISNSNDVRTFTAHRREISVQLGNRLSRAYTIQYRLVFRNVTESNLKINQLLVPLLSQPESVGLAEFSFIQDKRDDPTDAHRGIYTSADIGYAAGFLGSQTEFGRMLLRNSTYHGFHHDFVLARSTQFGVIARTGGRPSIPLAERLYSGGSTSIRAFPDFQAGPRDLVTGFPLGGNALLINNTELRFPLYGDNLNGVLFHDAGNVYGSITDFSPRFRQTNLQDFNYMVQDVGFGIRYRTPIGPVRVDLSFSPDAPRFFGLKGTLQQYLNGTAISTVQKINAFQFHISLGQAF
ncbi:MAG: BamA/TamA family outer membrane protein, partial [Acidobacteriaceae bacterium]|nr:BamA/TamA family outer membrane protein [Acidobacteriaceae bacterium]